MASERMDRLIKSAFVSVSFAFGLLSTSWIATWLQVEGSRNAVGAISIVTGVIGSALALSLAVRHSRMIHILAGVTMICSSSFQIAAIVISAEDKKHQLYSDAWVSAPSIIFMVVIILFLSRYWFVEGFDWTTKAS